MSFPIEKRAIAIASNGMLYAGRNRRMWALQHGDRERTIDPDDVTATETLIDVFADPDLTEPVAQPLYSERDGGFPCWVAETAYDLYLPGDPWRPLQTIGLPFLTETEIEALALAAIPDALIVGAITRDAHGAATAAAAVWPDGDTGAYTGTASTSFPGAIDSYEVTKGARTYTQPTMTRDATGAVTIRPAIEVS